jgi:hypothetical protein
MALTSSSWLCVMTSKQHWRLRMKTQIKIGVQGYKFAYQLLTQLGNTIKKVGRQHHKMVIGDTFVWTFTERYSTGNIAFEWSDDKPTLRGMRKRRGWYTRMLDMAEKPSVILHVCLNQDKDNSPIITCLDVEKLVAFLTDHWKEFPMKQATMSIVGTQSNETKNLIVPLRELHRAGVVRSVYGLNALNQFQRVYEERYEVKGSLTQFFEAA